MRIILKTIAILLTLSTTWLPAPASAEWKDGNVLLDHCSKEKDDPVYYINESACLMYILGVYDGLEMDNAIHKTKKYYCVPENVQARQIREIVVAYLKKHPENRQWPAAGLITIALKEAFPCKANLDAN